MANSVSSFELHKKFTEAVKSGRYMITISTCDKKGKKIDHFMSTKDFPRDDMMPSVEKLAELALSEAIPNAANNS